MFGNKQTESSIEGDQQKQWQLIEKMAMSSIQEQRRTRRWGIVFKFLTFAYLVFILIAFSGKGAMSPQLENRAEPHTAVVRVHGPIMDEQEAAAGRINHALREAFEAEQAKAVILAINSPGGSPVHAGYVYDEIERLRAQNPEKKVYAVISDIGASAAYYIASAADEIYADKASLVGSIGVISASFGFDKAMEKLGIERRVMTAGDNKAFLDPYQPWKAEEKVFWQKSLGIIHQQFIAEVKKGRGDRLVDEGDVFGGYIWTGEQALEKGLVDGLASVRGVAREQVGEEELVDYTAMASPLEQLMKQLGGGMASAFITELKTGWSTAVIQ